MQNNADDPFAYLNETRRQFESLLKKRLLAPALQTFQHWVNNDPVNPPAGEYQRAQEQSNNGLSRQRTPLAELPSCVDFRHSPPITVNSQITSNESSFVRDHGILGNNQHITVDFFVSESDLTQQVSLAITALVSRLTPSEGYAPVSLAVNDVIFVEDYTMPGGGYRGETSTFMIPAHLLRGGTNSVTIRVAPDARSYFWLYEVTVGCGNVQKPKTMDNGLFRYETSHAWGNFSAWHQGAPLSIFIDSGEDAFPASLHWRDQQGNTGSISLQTDMSSYIGYYQRAHEGPIAYRGRLEKRIPLSEARRTHQHCQIFTYQAEHSWGENTDEWHPCNDLVFCIESGEGALLACLDWRDQKGNAGSISFQSDMRSFYGYYQRLGEGPISYQGRFKQEKDKDRDKSNDECLHENDAPSSTLRVIEPFRRAGQWYDEGPFDDTPLAYPSGLSIRKFFLQAGQIVDGIQASYGEEHIQLTPPHGNVNLHSTEIVLDPGDSWSEISGFHGSWFGGIYVLQLTFRTRLGRVYGPFGSMDYASESVPFTLRLEPHESIIALKGVVSTGDNGKNSHLGALGLVLGSVVQAAGSMLERKEEQRLRARRNVPMWRHGDVFIAQIEAIPPGIPATKRSILARGEMTGHSHRLETPANATMYVAGGEMYVLVMNPVRIIHEEHRPITLQPGTYRVWQQREYTPQAIRKIID